MYPQCSAFHYKSRQSCILTAEAVLDSHCQFRDCHWHHFISHGFTLSAKKHSRKEDLLTQANGAVSLHSYYVVQLLAGVIK